MFRKGERFDGIIAAPWPVGKILMRAFGNSTFWELLLPMSELLEAGQASVWVGTGPGSGEMVPGAPVVVKPGPDDASVEITLFDGDVLRNLFAQKPPTIELVTRAPGLADQRYTIPVTYSEK